MTDQTPENRDRIPAQLYSDAEMDALAADAARIGMPLGEYVHHMQETSIGLAAALIMHPELRPPALSRTPIGDRILTITLLEVIDGLFAEEDQRELRATLIAKADAHLALIRRGH